MRATRRRLLAGVATACVVLAGSAAAKEGIRATILSGLPTTAAPGSTITVRWRLQDARREPADLLDAFIRVLGPGGVARVGVPTDAAHPDGLYEASVKVPPGGVVAVQAGATEQRRAVDFSLRRDPFRGWSALYRPLVPPRISPGEACPTSPPETHVDFRRFGVARGWGSGPAYPIGLTNGTIALAHTMGPWAVQKILWWVHPRYRGLVLIRGRQLDGRHLVRFETGTLPPAELRIGRGASDGVSDPGRGRPSFVRIRAPGCYAFQIDGTSFSRFVVFRAA